MKKIRNTFYLIGPLALVAFFLFDFIGGMNYPGFDWINQSPLDIIAWDSYDLVLGFVFSIIAALLAIAAGFLVYKFFKAWKPNKVFLTGILCVFLAVIVSGLGFNIFHPTNAGTIEYVAELHVQNMAERASIAENENKIFDEKYMNKSSESAETNSDSSASTTTDSASVNTATTDSTDADSAGTSASSDTTSASTSSNTSSAQAAIDTSNQKISENTTKIVEKITDPNMIGIIVVSVISTLLVLLGCLLLAIGGLRKSGIKTIGIVSIVLGALALLAVLYTSFGQYYLGYSSRIILYMPYVLVAFLSAWIYAYEPAE